MTMKEVEKTDADVFTKEENAEKFPQLDSSEEKNQGKDGKLDTVIDISGEQWDFPMMNGEENSVEEVYVYKNEMNLVPRDVGRFKGLKTLKFFSNQLNLLPQEFGNLGGLEHLQLKVAALGVNGFELSKLRNLKELELSRLPSRPSAFPILSQISGLKCLTRLSVCHFSIRYLPPEIGCLDKLEYLDLSFNKMRSLPDEISLLKLLRSLKVANNKLIDIPSQLSYLQRLEDLDLSNNRLTSLECLDLESMHNLRILKLQHNQLSRCPMPSWICCTLEGNISDLLNDESTEMDLNEDVIQEIHGSFDARSSIISGLSPNNHRSLAKRRPDGWKRQYIMRTKAQRERSNNLRKWKVDAEAQKSSEKCLVCTVSACSEKVPSKALSVEGEEHEKSLTSPTDENSSLTKESVSGCSCFMADFDVMSKPVETDNFGSKGISDSVSDDGVVLDGSISSTSSTSSTCVKSKRHSEKDLDNPKPTKSQRPTNDPSYLSCQFSEKSFCGIADYLPDGFYDAGRDRPYMPLDSYEQNFHVNLREVVLLDRARDEQLDAILLRARAFLSRFKQMNNSVYGHMEGAIDRLQIASLLALFVSDHFGGSDKSVVLQRTRKAVFGSKQTKPFVCTCTNGIIGDRDRVCKLGVDNAENIPFNDICDKSLQSVKERHNSLIVPIGGIQFGVCRHRALLMKYLCDRMEPRIPCELVRGYLDYTPHAWNVIVTERGDSSRMIVDACHPHDIREESDPEYFCRYIPLSRVCDNFVTDPDGSPNYSFPSLSLCAEIGKVGSTSMMHCNVGGREAAVKVRTMEVNKASVDEVRNFELSCLGEVRMLSSLKHSCLVEFYGHRIWSKWSTTPDGNPGGRTIQSAILMEYIKGGSLKDYIEKLSGAGEKHVAPNLALNIARDVAFALTELHSRDIIHRDVKSDNILVDLESKRPDGSHVVKICDLDRAVPASSYMHSCCIAHVGVPPPDICVGTPRWMAPEVFRAMHQRNIYGLEVDIWSFGCVLLELLTLRVPYADLPEPEIHNLLQSGERPKLTDELEDLAQSDSKLETEPETLRFLAKLYHQCTEHNPADRPSADKIYGLLADRVRSVADSTTSDRE